jgi:hypothetical protein
MLLGIVALPVIATAFAVAVEGELSDVRERSAAFLTSPTPRTITDERQVRIVATALPGPEVAAGPARGTITAVGVAPGDTLVDGAVLFQVDGIDRFGFASSIPFYRPISPGTEGPDVVELHRLLALEDIIDDLPADPAIATFATGQAISRFAGSLGAGRTTTFDPGWVVFLPSPDLIAASVSLKIGQPAPSQGAVIITTPGTVTSARLASGNQEPLNFAPGVEYIAIVDGKEFTVDTATQSIAATELARLRAPGEPERDGIPALTKRKTPLQTLAVPSSSVMTNDAGTLCVWRLEDKAYRAVTVTIAGARGGVTNVASGIAAQDQVLANPAQVLEAPQCP